MLSPVRLLVLFITLAGCAACASPEAVKPTPAPTKEIFAPFQKTTLHYLDQGKGDIPLILVHGWAGQSGVWRNQSEDLSRDHRVIALDLPGHGASGRLKTPYTQKIFAEAVLAVMDHAKIKRAVLVGHSMGASVIRQAAILAPERMAGLVLIDGAILFPPQNKEERLAWAQEMRAFARHFVGPKSDAFTEGFIDSMHGRTTPQWAKDEILARIMTTPNAIRASAMRHFVDSKVWDGQPVKTPTLALYVKSQHTGPDLEPKLRSLFPSLDFTLWDGPGHFFMLYEQEKTNEQIRSFVAQIKSRPTDK